MMRRSSSSISRLVLIIVAFVSILLILRTPVTQYTDYLSGKPPQADLSLNPPKIDAPTEDRPYEQSHEAPLPADEKSTSRSRISLEMQEYLSWDPPLEQDHYPPYDHYRNRDYDPNRWEAFEQ